MKMQGKVEDIKTKIVASSWIVYQKNYIWRNGKQFNVEM